MGRETLSNAAVGPTLSQSLVEAVLHVCSSCGNVSTPSIYCLTLGATAIVFLNSFMGILRKDGERYHHESPQI